MRPIFLLDLGGVLIDLNWVESAKKIFGPSESKDTLFQKWASLKSVRNLETGKIDFKEFSLEFSNEIDAPVTMSEIENAFLDIIGPVKANCENMITELKKMGKVAMLSNTNSVHIAKLKSETKILDLFNKTYLSYKLKCVKPDKEIFELVITDLDCNPHDIYFFDDSLVNVNGAKQLGINSFQVFSPDEILAIARNLFNIPSK